MNELVLIRGLPGSGKSTMAKSMHNHCHYEADMFFTDGGGYKFDPSRLKDAHAWCLDMARLNLERGFSVVVSNTFSRAWEMRPYLDAAKRLGVKVRIIEARGDFGNIHNVPAEAIERMRARWETLDQMETAP